MKINISTLMLLAVSTSYSASSMSDGQVQKFLELRDSKEQAMILAMSETLGPLLTFDLSDISDVTHKPNDNVTTILVATLSSGIKVTATKKDSCYTSVICCSAKKMRVPPESFYVIQAWYLAYLQGNANKS